MINKIVITPVLLMATGIHLNPRPSLQRAPSGQGASQQVTNKDNRIIANLGQIDLMFRQRKEDLKISNIDIPPETLKARISLTHQSCYFPFEIHPALSVDRFMFQTPRVYHPPPGIMKQCWDQISC